MLPKNPLLQYNTGRIHRAGLRIAGMIGAPAGEAKVFAAAPSAEHVGYRQARDLEMTEVTGPHRWGKLFDQRWFKLIPPTPSNRRPRFLHWVNQGEATVYVDGVPFSGLDERHHVCSIPAGAEELWLEVMAAESAMWSTGTNCMSDHGCRFDGAPLVYRDALAWEVHHDFAALEALLRAEHAQYSPETRYPAGSGHLQPIERASVLYRKLLRGLDEVVDALDNGGLPAARTCLRKLYKQLPPDGASVRCVLTGHAHIDLVWQWPERSGEFKALHSMATANRLMEVYPELHFGYSQPASYEAVGRRSPEMIDLVRRRIDEGRWDATGAMYVEADSKIPCGEALARGFLLGQEGFQALRGRPATVLWLPDSFGYAACLPQIMQQTGVKAMFTTKLTWGNITRFPYSSFLWRGLDGSEVLVHVSHHTDYNGRGTVGELREAVLGHRQSDVHDETLVATGYGDGGGGPDEDICERIRRLAKLAGSPPAEWGGIESFFDRLEAIRGTLPAYRGELDLQYHRGVPTTHGRLKAAYRKAERGLQVAEAARCATTGRAVDEAMWKRLIFAQFHDHVTGTSIHEVYDEAVPELESLGRRGDELAATSLGGAGTACLFNPLPLRRWAIVDGKRVEAPPLTGGPIAKLKAVPAAEVRVGERRLSNGRVKARFNAVGEIAALDVDGKTIDAEGPMGRLVLYPDHPHGKDCWAIDRGTVANGTVVDTPAKVIATSGGQVGEIAFQRQLGRDSRLITRYRLDAGATALQMSFEIDWRERQTLLKAIFPTRYAGRNARFGQPFGSILRPQHPGEPIDEARYEVAASRWAAVCDDTERDGLFLAAEAKYGFAAREGCLQVSLVRSAAVILHGTLPGARRADLSEPLSDIGAHTIRMAVGRYDADAPRHDQPAALAETLFTPPIAYRGEAVDAGLIGLEGGESLQPCWARPLGKNRWALRLHETLGRRGEATVKLRPGWTASAGDLLSRRAGKRLDRGVIRFEPYQLLTVIVAKRRSGDRT